jgi:hypothetical protein
MGSFEIEKYKDVYMESDPGVTWRLCVFIKFLLLIITLRHEGTSMTLTIDKSRAMEVYYSHLHAG